MDEASCARDDHHEECGHRDTDHRTIFSMADTEGEFALLSPAPRGGGVQRQGAVYE